MPSALALAHEVTSNHERSAFATNFAKSLEDKERKPYAKTQGRQQGRQSQQADSQSSGSKNPHFNKQNKPQAQSDQRSGRQQNNNGTQVPMEVNPSLSRILHPTQAPAFTNRKQSASDRSGGQRGQQRLNHVLQDAGQRPEAYANAAASVEAQVDDDTSAGYDSDAVNFLGGGPCCPSSDEE